MQRRTSRGCCCLRARTDLLYENLGGLATRSTTVFLDACFSGGSPRGMLIQSASPVYVEADISGGAGLTVLTAASGAQLASWDEEARHGLFTEHLLDGLYGAADADGDGNVTAREAKLHLDRTMTRAARREFGRVQDAGLHGDESAVLAFSSPGGWDSRPLLGPPPAAFTVRVEPADARVRILNIGPAYRAGMGLPAGSYEVEASAEGYVTKTVTVTHGTSPTVHRVVLSRPGQPFTIVAEPAEALVRLLDHAAPYQPGMLLPPGAYRVEASAKGYVTKTEPVAHGTSPTVHRVVLSRPGQPFTIVAEPAEALVRLLDHTAPYQPGMLLPPGAYQVEASAEGYETTTESVAHGGGPTVRRIALRIEGPKAGEQFTDCAECPEMVVVPAGSYRMSGQHEVTIGAPFAVGKYEVTFAQWDACVRGGGCPQGKNIAKDRGWGRGQRPVIYVSWNDAQRYVRWLSGETKKPYRLLSESEWEYAARAGTVTAYSWGDEIGVGRANCRGCGSQRDRRQTAPVGSFASNAWGLHDMHGNVFEWAEDCWNGSYAGSPRDGSAWLSGNCSKRVLRGGSWNFTPTFLRAALRNRNSTGNRIDYLGFRVARTLAP